MLERDAWPRRGQHRAGAGGFDPPGSSTVVGSIYLYRCVGPVDGFGIGPYNDHYLGLSRHREGAGGKQSEITLSWMIATELGICRVR